MFRPRIIPVLLLKGQGLVKSTGFKNYKYIGDPINAVRLFNDLRADELIFLDILATREKRMISLDFVKHVGEEANMAFGVGGGIRTIDQIQRVIGAGAEKVVIGTHAAERPDFIKEASEAFGSSTITVCMDIKRSFFGGEMVCIEGGSKQTKYNPVDFAQLMEEKGAGELIVQSVKKDGSMEGYDIRLIDKISHAVTIPVVALGGAGKIEHLRQAYTEGHASALAAGSMFVYQGPHRGVLINYPEKNEIVF